MRILLNGTGIASANPAQTSFVSYIGIELMVRSMLFVLWKYVVNVSYAV